MLILNCPNREPFFPLEFFFSYSQNPTPNPRLLFSKDIYYLLFTESDLLQRVGSELVEGGMLGDTGCGRGEKKKTRSIWGRFPKQGSNA